MWGLMVSPDKQGATKSHAELLTNSSAEAEQTTDSALARQIVNSTYSIERRAFLRELIWRWRDYTETERPWLRNPEYVAWWE